QKLQGELFISAFIDADFRLEEETLSKIVFEFKNDETTNAIYNALLRFVNNYLSRDDADQQLLDQVVSILGLKVEIDDDHTVLVKLNGDLTPVQQANQKNFDHINLREESHSGFRIGGNDG
ncbi:MAG TPA: hypothetical protein VLG38_03425, partial [Gammaproteobacteria bacterium]|nr:hypothetical protein [Gammaproteobacteria bacterium]